MARQVISTRPPRPKLLIPKEEATEKVEKQLEKGRNIRDLPLNNELDLQNKRKEKEKWVDFTAMLLENIFENEYYANEFKQSYGSMRMAMNIHVQVENFMNEMDAKITNLESLKDMIEIIEVSTAISTPQDTEDNKSSKNIFIVHGHDELIKTEVARFVEKMELVPIILHERPHQGMTLIEKLEHYSDVGFAIILITPDDEGYQKGQQNEAKPRARQNVIAELGFFVGKLKRKKVCVLYMEGVELPTDFDGVGYYPYDNQGAWKILVGKELRESGLPVDLNKI